MRVLVGHGASPARKLYASSRSRGLGFVVALACDTYALFLYGAWREPDPLEGGATAAHGGEIRALFR